MVDSLLQNLEETWPANSKEAEGRSNVRSTLRGGLLINFGIGMGKGFIYVYVNKGNNREEEIWCVPLLFLSLFPPRTPPLKLFLVCRRRDGIIR